MGILLYYLFSISGKKLSFMSFVTKVAMIFGLYLLFTGFIFFSFGGLKGYFSYSPEIAKSLDAIKDADPLKYGVANYWDAKLITMFSKKGIKVYPIHDGLIPYTHVTNQNGKITFIKILQPMKPTALYLLLFLFSLEGIAQTPAFN